MIKAILFDLDNTLVDFMRMKRLACEAAVGAMIGAGLKTDRKKAMKVLFEMYDKYGMEYDRIFQVFLKRMTGRIDYGIMGAGIVAYRRVRENLLEPYPEVMPTLRKLKRYKLGIVTDAPRIKAWIRLAAMNLQSEFDFVLTFDDTKRKKPDPRPFLMAIRKLKLRPDQIAMVGDMIEKDIEPARKLGMVTVLAKYGQITPRKSKADFEIRKFRELLKILIRT